MEFSIKHVSPEKLKSDCLIVGVFEAHKLSVAAEALDKTLKNAISAIVNAGDMDGKLGSSLVLHHLPGAQCARILLVGLGPEKTFREAEYGTALRAALQALSTTGATQAVCFLTDMRGNDIALKQRSAAWCVRQAALIAQESFYRFDTFKSTKDQPARALKKLVFVVDEVNAQTKDALKQGLAIAEGVKLAKDLGNLPGNVCTPTYLAETAQQLAQDYALDCEVLEKEAMEKLGMHALLSVAKGSRQAPKFIVLHYRGAKKSKNKDAKPLVLVGKGITFDSGGISLKPGADMDQMKFDMCGAASVLGAIKAVAELALPINLTVLVPSAENMPGGAASKPGDIVYSMSGQSIEILNTDAEGRLILCDALTYAERFKPQAVIDVATLTGACVIALGHVASGLFANDEQLAEQLFQAGEAARDRAWEMPIWAEYQELIKSPFADMANVGGRAAGSISAACFLARFTEKFAWAHLDIAGSAWKAGSDKSATGRPVSLLAHFLLERAEVQLN